VAAAAVLVCSALAACGGGAPDELTAPQGRALAEARAGLDDALDTSEALRTSDEETRRIVSEVREIVSRGAFESDELDEFGLAALGELSEVVPSLVGTSERGTPRTLDRPATRAFLAQAGDDPARALLIPARQEVEIIERTVGDSEADAETTIPPPDRTASGDATVGDFLDEAIRDTRSVWPGLSERLGELRAGLDD
jgi:hypothetical protein